jgi:hypothetical protein
MTVLTVLVMCLAGGGCGGCRERVTEKALERAMSRDGVDADVDIKGGRVSVQTKDGKLDFNAGKAAKIPADFPKDVHIPDGTPLMAMNTPQGGMLSLQCKATPDAIIADYKQKMPAAGWTEQMSLDMGAGKTLSYAKEKRVANIMVGADDGKTTVVITLGTEQ